MIISGAGIELYLNEVMFESTLTKKQGLGASISVRSLEDTEQPS